MANDYKKTWNAATSKAVFPDFYLGLTEALINNYLEKHRTKDNEVYASSKEFSGANGALFKVMVTAGASKKSKKLTPLEIDLAPLSGEKTKGYFPIHIYRPTQLGSHARKDGSDTGDPVVLSVKNCMFEFYWKRADGKEWNHLLDGIDFLIELETNLVESNGAYSISYRATRLQINRNDLTKIQESISSGLAEYIDSSGVDLTDCDVKISDLFVALLQVTSTELASNLAGSIEIPAFRIGDFDVYTNVFRVMDNMIVVGGSTDSGPRTDRAVSLIHSYKTRLDLAFDEDLEAAGGPLALLYGRDNAKKINSMEPAIALATMRKLSGRKRADPISELPRIKAILTEIRQSAKARQIDGKPPAKMASMTPAAIAVAINEYSLDRMVGKFGNSYNKECTRTIPLALIKGRLCYEVATRNPDISISKAGLTGSVYIYVFAGIEYWLKKFWDCSWRWDGPHKSGIGIKGEPKVTISTKPSKYGLWIKADFSLKGVELFTGDKLADEILKLLSPLFMGIVEGFLDALANLLTFVVLPVELAVSSQKTVLKLSNFETDQYTRVVTEPPEPPLESQLNFLMVTADSSAE